MLTAISSDKLPIVAGIAAGAVIHYILAVVATTRLLKFKSRLIPMPLWHFLIQLVPLVGPVLFLLTHINVTEQRFDLKRLAEEKAAREATEKEQQEEKAEEAEQKQPKEKQKKKSKKIDEEATPEEQVVYEEIPQEEETPYSKYDDDNPYI